MKVYNEEWVESFHSKIKSNMGELERALGTLEVVIILLSLIEVKAGAEYITVHSGSEL